MDMEKACGTKESGKILYVSDLDGTLMRNDETLSGFTVRTLNELIGQGLAFTYATARSVESARKIAGDLKLSLPVVTRNGAVLADNSTGRHLEKAVFTEDAVHLLKGLLPELPETGFVSCFFGDKMIKSFIPGNHSPGMIKYLAKNINDPLLQPEADFDSLFRGKPGYVSLIDSREKMAPVYERMRKYSCWECLFQKDTYWEEYWLEIFPKNCSKANAVLGLKKTYGFEKLVVFGDSVNDLSMFRIADEAYAVAGSAEDVKAAASAVIGSNEEDAVAAFLKARWNEQV